MKLEQIKANCFGDEAATHRHAESQAADYDRRDFAALLALVPMRLAQKKNETRHEGTVDSCKSEVCVIGQGARRCQGKCVHRRGGGQLCPLFSLTPF